MFAATVERDGRAGGGRRAVLLLPFLLVIGMGVFAQPAYALSAKDEMLKQHNSARQKCRIGPLRHDAKLEKAAQDYANHLAKKRKVGHAVDSSLGQRVSRAGYRGAAGENLFSASGVPKSIGHKVGGTAVKAWMRSTGHRKNVLGKQWKKAGFGIATSKGWGMVVVGVYGR